MFIKVVFLSIIAWNLLQNSTSLNPQIFLLWKLCIKNHAINLAWDNLVWLIFPKA